MMKSKHNEIIADIILTPLSYLFRTGVGTLHLTINYPKTNEFSATACSQYKWNNSTYTKSDDYVQLFKTTEGCDSTVTLHLTVNKEQSTLIKDSICQGEEYDKNGFNISAIKTCVIGVYSFEKIETSINGCDSIISLKLTILPARSINFTDIPSDTDFYCAGDEVSIHYSLASGNPDTYDISFDEKAIEQEFRESSGTVISNGVVSFDTPFSAKPGVYTAYLTLKNRFTKSQPIPVKFAINYGSEYLKMMWNDVVACSNKNDEFVAYQWYHEDSLIAGATKQMYCDLTGISGNYSVKVTTKDGNQYFICSKYFEKKTAPFNIMPAPNPATANEIFLIKVKGLNDNELKRARLFVYAENGEPVYATDNVQKDNKVKLPIGKYVAIVIVDNDKSANCKILVLPQ